MVCGHGGRAQEWWVSENLRTSHQVERRKCVQREAYPPFRRAKHWHKLGEPSTLPSSMQTRAIGRLNRILNQTHDVHYTFWEVLL